MLTRPAYGRGERPSHLGAKNLYPRWEIIAIRGAYVIEDRSYSESIETRPLGPDRERARATRGRYLRARKAVMAPRDARGLGVFVSLADLRWGECTAERPVVSSSTESTLVRWLRLRLKTDEELVEALLANEPDALTILFQRHSALVFQIARRILRSDVEAEDAVQQVFLDVFRAVQQFAPGKSSFKSWLLMFAYHRTFNRLRQLRTHGFYHRETAQGLSEQLLAANRQLALTPTELAVWVEQLLGALPPRQRRVIELTYYEGLTAEEAAKVTGESVRVVRHNLYRGLDRLRSVISRQSADDEQTRVAGAR